jgi:hypothetical protein
VGAEKNDLLGSEAVDDALHHLGDDILSIPVLHGCCSILRVRDQERNAKKALAGGDTLVLKQNAA